MDDKTFDDSMKKRLEDYKEPPFDASSLDALSHTLPSMETAPWYSTPVSRLFAVSSMVLFTMINSAILFFVFNETNQLRRKEKSDISAMEMIGNNRLAFAAEVDSLRNVIEKMQCDLQQAKAGNISNDNFVEKPDQVNKLTSFAERGAQRQAKIQGLRSEAYPNKIKSIVSEHPDSPEFWRERSPMVIERFHPGTVRFVEVKSPAAQITSNDLSRNPSVMTLATQKALDKHYFKGVGVEIAPHVDLVQGIFKHGESDIQPRFGIATDLILSPNWSAETGVDYFNTSSHFSPNDINLPAQRPGSEYGSLHSVGTKYSLLSVPVALKYRQWITPSHQLFVKIGWKPYVSASRELQYNYDAAGSTPDQGIVQVTTLDHHDEVKYFGSTMTASLGLTRKMKNPKNKFEVSLFYEKSIGTVGQENLTMQLAGIRTAYWFKLK